LRLISKIQLADLGNNDYFFYKSAIYQNFTLKIPPMWIGFFIESEITYLSHGEANEGFMVHLFDHKNRAMIT
jgi:hypothetical protein